MKCLNKDVKELLKPYTTKQGVAMLVAGIIVGALATQLLTPSLAILSPVRDQNSSYAFINPLLFYNSPSQPDTFKKVFNQIQKRVDDFKNQDKKGAASVYLKDLNTGKWAGINSSEQYNPASLLKVAVMIAYFKEAETKPSTLYRTLNYSQAVKDSYASIPYEQGTSLILGHGYTVKDLIERMIIRSDNGATYTLLSAINIGELNGVFRALNIENPEAKGREYTISAERYAYFFRILYNATYLDRDDSERALSLLSQSDFSDGLVAGVPEDTTVAHKFGENVAEAVELHDCGIIYYPKDNPYLLCAMTRGSDINNLKSLIKDISALVYKDRAVN